MVHVGFMDLQKAYDRVNRKALWQVLRMYDVGSKLLRGIKRIYVNSLAYVRERGAESKRFRVENSVRQGWRFSVYMDAGMKRVKGEMGRVGIRYMEREESGDCLVSCIQMTWFCVLSWRD